METIINYTKMARTKNSIVLILVVMETIINSTGSEN